MKTAEKDTVVFLFNHSLHAMKPWLDSGTHNVVSVDFNETDHSKYHHGRADSFSAFSYTVCGDPVNLYRLNIDLSLSNAKEVVESAVEGLGLKPASMVISFAPCTDLAVSGAAHFEKKRTIDPEFQHKAAKLAMLASTFGCAYAVENPVSVLATLWRKPDMYWNPCDFAGYCPAGAHPEFPDILPEQDRYNKKTCLWTGNGFVHPSFKHMPPMQHMNPAHQKLGGKSARTKYIRSLTPRGFSQAVFEANTGAAMVPFQTELRLS
jgi:hypothetical protein